MTEAIIQKSSGPEIELDENSRQLLDMFVYYYTLRQFGDFVKAYLQLEATTSFLHLISSQQIPGIVNEAKRHVIHYPQGLFLSDKAMHLIFRERSKYDFRISSNTDFSIIDSRVVEIYLSNGNRYVGRSKFNINHDSKTIDEVDQRLAYLHRYSGVGLLMLDYLQDYARQEKVRAIRLTTNLRPIGLGNLGFDYVDSGILDPIPTKEFRYRWQNPEFRD